MTSSRAVAHSSRIVVEHAVMHPRVAYGRPIVFALADVLVEAPAERTVGIWIHEAQATVVPDGWRRQKSQMWALLVNPLWVVQQTHCWEAKQIVPWTLDVPRLVREFRALLQEAMLAAPTYDPWGLTTAQEMLPTAMVVVEKAEWKVRPWEMIP